MLVVIGGFNVYIDPFFHYHVPLEDFAYLLDRNNERYQNYGILTHFSYDTIITGTSLTENFKSSECDAIFGGTTVKVPLAGATYKEINEQLEKAFESDNEITTVIRSLDLNRSLTDKDAMMENYVFPTYMTNKNILDDVFYILNKDVTNLSLQVLQRTQNGEEMTTFDTYANWMAETYFGKEYVLLKYDSNETTETEYVLTQEEVVKIKENINQNIIELVEAHPQTTFYLFIPPYSICYWHELVNKGELSWMLETEKILIEELLPYSNIKLYSFENDFETICNLDNYIDLIHYGDWINTHILQCLMQENYILTKENYMDYLNEMKEFLLSYDYKALQLGGNENAF